MRPGHSVWLNIRLTKAGADLITILRCSLSFKTVLTPWNIIVFKIKFLLPKNGHPSHARILLPRAISWCIAQKLQDNWMYPLMTCSHYLCMTLSIILSLVSMSKGCLIYLVVHLHSCTTWGMLRRMMDQSSESHLAFLPSQDWIQVVNCQGDKVRWISWALVLADNSIDASFLTSCKYYEQWLVITD